jgi:CubicO group peptidase (beta-lactamase class C family)
MLKTRLLNCLLLLAFCSNSILGTAQGLSSEKIDSLANKTLEMFPLAGFAVSVVHNGEVVHANGYGVRSIKTQQPINENTLFAIASNSKSFTAAALAILVDEGKLSWKDKVVDHIPEFTMYNSYVRDNFTVEDLLCHRSGLGLGAGDLMIFPDGSDFDIDDILQSFQHQKPVSAFRTKYDYDNLLYIVAGEIVQRISGMSWSEFVEHRIMKPLQMKASAGSFKRIQNTNNIALPHSSEYGDLEIVDAYTNPLMDAAGGIYSSVNDLSKWLMMHLNKGKYGEDQELFSVKNQNYMWKAHTMLNFSARGGGKYKNHYKAYGLGWVIEDYNGYTIISHTGGLPGMLSKTVLIPELNVGIAVLTNTLPGGYAYHMIPQAIIDSYIEAEPTDWNAFASKRLSGTQHEVDSVVNAVWKTVDFAKDKTIEKSDYIGMYKDNWFGKMEVYEKEGELWIRSLRSPKLTGPMYYYKANSFAVKWAYRDMNCDAFAIFALDEEGKAQGLKMKGISPNIDFSFDFQDLDLKRVE